MQGRSCGRRNLPIHYLVVLWGALACGGSGDGGNGGGIVTPLVVPVSVTVSPATLSLAQGASSQLSVQISGGNPTPTLGGCSSSDASIVTTSIVGSGCGVTGVRPGTAAITATAGSGSASATVTVTPLPVTITMDPSTLTLVLGRSSDLTVRISGGTGPRLETCTTSSATVATAAVAGAGICRVTAVSPGSATITANTNTGERANTAVTVIEPTIARVVLAPTADTVRVGSARQLSATLLDAQGATVTSRSVLRWSSSAPAIATVDSLGRVTAIAAGAATISATIPSITGSTVSITGTAAVTVVSPVRSLRVTPATGSVRTGQALTLSASITVDGGSSTGILWRSSNASVATVSGTETSATVTGVAVGSATITAVAQADTSVRVTVPISVVTGVRSIVIAPRTDSIFPTQSRTYTATVTADQGVSTAITWTSRNPTVAAVSSAGVMQAMGIGSTMIVARSIMDTLVADSVRVVVADPCVYRPLHVLGTTTSGTLSSASCTGQNFYESVGRYTVTTESVVRYVATVTMPTEVFPLRLSSGSWYRNSSTTSEGCLLLAPGSWNYSFGSAAFGSFSFATTTPSVGDRCTTFNVAMTGSRGQVAINAYNSTYVPNGGGMTGSRLGVQFELVPVFNIGQTVTITAIGTGIEPWIELFDSNLNFLTYAGGAGQTTVTLTRQITAAGYYRMRVLTRVAGQTGTVTVAISGSPPPPEAVQAGTPPAVRLRSGPPER